MEKSDSMFVHLAAPVASSHPFPLDPYQHFVGFYANYECSIDTLQDSSHRCPVVYTTVSSGQLDIIIIMTRISVYRVYRQVYKNVPEQHISKVTCNN